MEKIIRFLLATTFLFMGIVIGFLWSPVKNGVYCGNNSGNHYGRFREDEVGPEDLPF